MARIVVKVEPRDPGRFQAVCRTESCTWTSPVHAMKVGAEDEARWHRESHRRGDS